MHIFKDLTMYSEYLSYSYPVAALAMIPYLFSHCPAAFRKRIVKRMSYVFSYKNKGVQKSCSPIAAFLYSLTVTVLYCKTPPEHTLPFFMYMTM